MKNKIYSLVVAIACLALFSACDPSLFGDILGSASLTVSNSSAETAYADSTDVNFSSSVADYVKYGDTISNIFLGADIKLTDANVMIEPYCGIQLNDTICQSYPIALPLTINDFANFHAGNLLTSLATTNIFIMAVNDTSWYVGYEGNIVLNDYPEYNYLAKGTIENVKAYYVTQSKIEYINDLINNNPSELLNLTFNDLFPNVTFNGNFSSRHMSITPLIESLQQ